MAVSRTFDALVIGVFLTASTVRPGVSFMAEMGLTPERSRAAWQRRIRAPLHADSYRNTVRPSTRLAMRSSSEDAVAFGSIVKCVLGVVCSTAMAFYPLDVFGIGERTSAGYGRLSILGAQPAAALTEEQEVVNDVWRVVNQAYVDPTFNGQDWRSVRMKIAIVVVVSLAAWFLRRLRRSWSTRQTLKKDFRDKGDAYAAVKGMLKVLGDPFTRFLTPQEYEAVTELASGGVAGVGLELAATPASGSQPAAVTVAAVVDGSPAEKAGVRSGDVLTAVNGDETAGIDLDAIAGKLRGTAGSTVRLDVKRGSRTIAYPLTREQFKYRAVSTRMASTGGRKVGVIAVKAFSKDTSEDVRAALTQCVGDGAEAIVMDLRHNPGGFFPGGINVARLFLESDQPIVSVVDRHGISDQYSTVTTGEFADIPLVLVVDERTASASEILTAALRDNGRAKLAGHKTFGKAKVQTLNQIFDGSGVAVTISLYKTPSGADINGKGIPVDYPTDCSYPSDALSCVPTEAWS